MSQDTSNNEEPTHMCFEIEASNGEIDIFGPVTFAQMEKDILLQHICTCHPRFTLEAVLDAIDLVMEGEEFAKIRLTASNFHLTLRLHKEYDQKVAVALDGQSGQVLKQLYLVREFQIFTNTTIERKDTIVKTLLPWLKNGKIPGRLEGHTYTFLDLEAAKEKAEAILNDAPEGTDLRPRSGKILKKSFDLEAHQNLLVGGNANEEGRLVRVVAVNMVDASKIEGKQMKQWLWDKNAAS